MKTWNANINGKMYLGNLSFEQCLSHHAHQVVEGTHMGHVHLKRSLEKQNKNLFINLSNWVH